MNRRIKLSMLVPSRVAKVYQRWRSTSSHRLLMRGAVLFGGAVLLSAALGTVGAQPHENRTVYAGTIIVDLERYNGPFVDSNSVSIELANLELKRALSLITYSARYNIPADLAALIYDTALEEGVDPELGFRLVRVESDFDPEALSHADAIGLAQVRLPTARFFVPDITAEGLYDRQLNLTIGFRFLRDLLTQFDDDLPLALIAYNRGPRRTRQLLASGFQPWNGYASSVLEGYEPPE